MVDNLQKAQQAYSQALAFPASQADPNLWYVFTLADQPTVMLQALIPTSLSSAEANSMLSLYPLVI